MPGTRARKIAEFILVVLWVMPAGAMAQSVRYVRADAAAGGDGLSWATAYRYLQDGLSSAADSGGAVTEIWVAAGTYRPDAGSGQTPGDRAASFQLLDQVSLFGGFAGFETSKLQRKMSSNPTRLSGDLLGNDSPNPMFDDNSYHVVRAGLGTGNVVVDGFIISGGSTATGAALNSGAGVAILGAAVKFTNCEILGNQTEDGGFPVAGSGAGLYCLTGTLEMRNCRLVGNRAGRGRVTPDNQPSGDGGSGGAAFLDFGTCTFVECEFTANAAGVGGPQGGVGQMAGKPGKGGAVRVNGGSARFIRCVFQGNTGGAGAFGVAGGSNGGDGGAIHAEAAVVEFDGSRFFGNACGTGGTGKDINGRPGGNGGAISAVNVNPLRLINSIFVANVAGLGGTAATGARPGAGGMGGAVFCDGAVSPVIVNCSFESNRAGAGGSGSAAGSGGDGGAIRLSGAAATIANCILYRNRAGVRGSGLGGNDGRGGAFAGSSTPIVTVTHCDVEQGQGGIFLATAGSTLDWQPGNIELDPLFQDANGSDNLLGTADDDLRLHPVSPCIDAGVNASVPPVIIADAGGFLRFLNAPASADCPYAPGTCGAAPIVDMGAFEFATVPLVAAVQIAPAASD